MTTPQRKAIEKLVTALKKSLEELAGCNWSHVKPEQIDDLAEFVKARIETISEKRLELVRTLKLYNTLYKSLIDTWEDDYARQVENDAYSELITRVRPILENVKPALAESKANLKLLQERADQREMPDGLEDLDLDEEDDNASAVTAQDDDDQFNPFSPNFEDEDAVNQPEKEESPKVNEKPTSLVDRGNQLCSDNSADQSEGKNSPKVRAQPPRPVLLTPSPAPIQFRVAESRKLPELTFGGNILEFRTFMTSFDAAFHKQPMTKAEKLSLLLGCLKGQAKTKFEGFGLTDDNYKVVRDLLESKYGSTDFLKQTLYAEMDSIKGKTGSLEEAEAAVDKFEKICRQLESLNEDVNHVQLELKFHKLLPATVLTAVLEQKGLHANWNLKKSRKLVDEFFNRRSQVASILGETYPQPKKVTVNAAYSPQPATVKPARPPQQVSEKRDTEAPRECLFCSTTGHHPAECSLDPENRLQEMINGPRKRCIRCLKTGHFADKCNRTCGICKAKHHTWLCKQFVPRSQRPKTDTVPEKRSVNAVQSHNDANTLLWTAKVSLVVGNETVSTTALIDPGSQKTLIKSSMIRQLRAKPIDEEKYLLATVGNATTQAIKAGIYELQMQLKDGSVYQFNASEIDNLVSELKLPATQLERDELETELQQIGLLIGMPDYFHLVPIGTRLRSGFHQIDSRLGPLIGGTGCLVASVAEETDRLTKMLDNFFSLESLGIDDNPERDENAEAVEMFKKSLTQELIDGQLRYQTPLLWRDKQDLSNTLEMCKSRLKRLYHELVNKNLLEPYHNLIQELIQQGFLEKADTSKDENAWNEGRVINFLPHHPVIRNDKAFTKIRQVIDAGAKTKGGRSLNSCLYTGPNLLADIGGVLLKTRMKDISVTADIAKAFLQISVVPDDRDALRFLWLKDHKKSPTDANTEVWRFTRVPFGTNQGPFLLNSTVKFHLEHLGTPLAMEILESIYADNIQFGAESTETALQKCQEAKVIMGQAAMPVREFHSNDPQVREKFADDPKETHAKVFGITWDLTKDLYVIKWPKWKHEQDHKLTRSDVLSQVASLYDPNGWTSPANLDAKIYLQKVHAKSPKEWKTLITEPALIEEWNEILTQNEAQSFHIPRKIPFAEDYEIHSFGDASGNAMAACCYIKVGSSTQLLLAKTKITPSKQTMTIPQKELVAAVMAIQLLEYAVKHLGIPPSRMVIWSDSKIVISWITSETDEKGVFIRNRVQRIRAAKTEIAYVATDQNPADIGTRGMLLTELNKSELWLQGPEWLASDASQWPEQPIPTEPPAETEVLIAAAISPFEESKIIDVNRFSDWTKLSRTRAYANRFIKLVARGRLSNGNPKLEGLQNLPERGPLLARDIKIAQKQLIQEAQESYPPSKEEVKAHKLIKRDGLFLCSNRLQQAGLTPIWLPKDSHLTKLIIMDVHRSCAHGSSSNTLNTLRLNYWISGGIKTIDMISKTCRTCIKDKAMPFECLVMPELPKERLQASRPFESVGIDYFGPLHVKDHVGADVKRYVALYTCATTRAVHLEIAQNMTAACFLQTFRRFISRRGQPRTIFSDQGSNFILARKAVEQGFLTPDNEDDSFVNYCANHQIDWKMSTPHAPWQGGFYERMVGLVKTALKAAIHHRKLDDEELQTIVIEVEAIVNSRVLTTIDPESKCQALRPVDFLLPLGTNGTPILDEDTEDPEFGADSSVDELRQLWARSNQYLNKSWERFRKEYLTKLLTRKDQHKKQRSCLKRAPRVGEVVLMEEENVPRGQWRLAIIEKVNENDQGQCRSVQLRLASGKLLERTIQQVYSLELETCQAAPEEEEASSPQEAAQPSERPRYPRRARPSSYAQFFAICMILLQFTCSMACPSWAIDCANTNSRRETLLSTVKNVKIRKLLKNNLPHYCNLMNPDKNCGERFHWENITRIRLLDGSDHYIQSLKLILDEKEGLQILLEDTYIPILAWGTIPVEVAEEDNTVIPCRKCHSSCINTGVQLVGESTIDLINVCVGSKCVKLESPSLRETANFDEGIVSTHYTATVEMWSQGKVVYQQELDCISAEPFCIFGLCPNFWLTITVILVLIMAVTGCFCLRICWKIVHVVYKHTVAGWFQQQGHQIRPRRRERRQRFLPKVTFLVLLAVAGAQGCAELSTLTATERQCQVDANGTRTCSINGATRIMLSPAENGCISLQNDQGQIIDSLKIESQRLFKQCNRELLFLSRPYFHEVVSIRRCPMMGSCVDDTCATIKTETPVEELQHVQEHAGYNGCMSGPEFIFNGCGLPTPSCVFYRVLARNKGTLWRKVFLCRSWTNKAEIKVSQGGKTHVVVLEAGETKLVDKIKLSLIQFNNDNILENVRFVQQHLRSALIPEEIYHLPYQCDANEKCIYKPLCQCHLAEESVRCICDEHDVLSRLLKMEYLPRKLKGFWIRPDLTMDYTDGNVEIQLSVENLTITTESELTNCDLQIGNLTGCRDCAEDATLDAICQAEYGEPTAELLCSSGNRHMFPCNGQRQVLNMEYSNLTIVDQCQFQCSNTSKTTFVQGQLKSKTHWISSFHTSGISFSMSPNPDDQFNNYIIILIGVFIVLLYLVGRVCRR